MPTTSKLYSSPQLCRISKTANHRNATYLGPHRLSIIHKCEVVLEHCLFYHHAPKATGTNQQ